MRDRLIELLKQAEKQQSLNAVCGDIDSLIDSPKGAEFIADHLLENGVVVPPCKVGDTVYVINEWEVEETAVFSMKIESEDSGWVVFLKARVTDYAIKSKDGYASIFKTFIFGKTVFLTREEAERALKGGEQ